MHYSDLHVPKQVCNEHFPATTSFTSEPMCTSLESPGELSRIYPIASCSSRLGYLLALPRNKETKRMDMSLLDCQCIYISMISNSYSLVYMKRNIHRIFFRGSENLSLSCHIQILILPVRHFYLISSVLCSGSSVTFCSASLTAYVLWRQRRKKHLLCHYNSGRQQITSIGLRPRGKERSPSTPRRSC